MTSIADNLRATRDRIAAACARAGRDAGSARLLAVSKRHPAAAVREAAAAGQRAFGENYAAELLEKAGEIEQDLEWHFIGHVQRNKVKLLVGRAALIHAVSSDRALREIDKRARAAAIVQPVLVAVSLAGEAGKSGVTAAELPDLVALAAELGGVRCDGLMTMPPLPDDPEQSRPVFRQLRELRDDLATPATPLAELSMGTTGDLEVAVEEGATWVRVGTAIFGPRSG